VKLEDYVETFIPTKETIIEVVDYLFEIITNFFRGGNKE